MDCTLMAAIAENGVIGKDGKLPWRLPEDMKRFKALTSRHPVIMGRKTYLSIPQKFRPLPDRTNIVLTHNPLEMESVISVDSIEEALKFCEKQYHTKMPYVIGGASVYSAALPYARALEITRIHKAFEGDVFFPELGSRFVKVHEWNRPMAETGQAFDYTYEVWLRRDLADLHNPSYR